MITTRCEICGLDHAHLGIEILDGVLLRRARASVHLLRAFGGAWAFTSVLWDAHLGEIQSVQITDQESGLVYHCSWQTMQRLSLRRTLDPRAGEQIILPLRYWSTLDTRTGAGDGAMIEDAETNSPRNETAQQLRFDLPMPKPAGMSADIPAPRRKRRAR